MFTVCVWAVEVAKNIYFKRQINYQTNLTKTFKISKYKRKINPRNKE
jgi:hypothetical protein